LKLGVSSLFAIVKGFNYLLREVEPHAGSFEVLEVLDEARTSLNGPRVEELRDLARSLGVELSLHAPFLDVNPASLSPSMRRASLKHLARSLEKAGRLECAVWVVHGGLYPHRRVRGLAQRLALSSLSKLAAVGEEVGVEVMVENSPAFEGCLFTEAREVVEALEGRVKLCLDLGHANISRQVDEFLALAKGIIGHVHAHDNDGRRDLHLTPGEGSIDWRRVLKALREGGFKGAVVIETASKPWRGLEYLRGLG